LRWSQETRVEWHYIAPGKPQGKGQFQSGPPMRRHWRWQYRRDAVCGLAPSV